MTRKLLLFIIFIIFLISSLTLGLIFNYLDPYRNELLSLITLFLTFLLFSTSFFSMLIYFIKKIYYRWEIFISHIFSTVRQSTLISIFFIGLFVFYMLGVFSITTTLLYIFIIIFVELLFQHI